MFVSNLHSFKVMTKAHTTLLLLSFLFLFASCGSSDDAGGGQDGGSGSASQSGTVDIYDPEVNGTFVTCSRVYEVDVSAWPSDGYPTGASGTYRYVSEDRYDGPKDGKMPENWPVIFRQQEINGMELIKITQPSLKQMLPQQPKNNPLTCLKDDSGPLIPCSARTA